MRLKKRPRHCTHCGRNNYIFEKYWTKFGRPEWAQLADSEPHAPCDTPQTPSNIHGSSGFSTIILSQKEYDQLCQLEFSQNGHSATHVSSSGRHTYTTLPQNPWVLDSGASSHMTGNKEKFMSLNLPSTYPSVKIVDGFQSPVLENGVIRATPSLTLTDVLFMTKFHVSLLPISQFTKHNNCKITLFFLLIVFQDLLT